MKFIAIMLAVAAVPITARSQLFAPPFVTAFQVINNSANASKTKESAIFSFTAVKSSLLAQLNWSTTVEQNNKGFRIERSSDGITFSQVALVPSQAGGGATAQNLNYIYFDDKPFPGMNYYRLTQTDSDGNEQHSTIAEVSFAKDAITVYPNPAKDNITIEGLAGNESIQLFSQNGQIIKKQIATGPVTKLDVSNIEIGVYRLTIADNTGKMITKKILKQ